MLLVVRQRHLALLVPMLAVLLGQVPAAGAVDRSCDPNDPVGNTANVICVDAGACTGSTVTITVPIDIPDGGGCEFDAGGRDFVVDKTFNVAGLGPLNYDGFVKVVNAGNITITGTGKLKARGDFVEPFGFILGGGTVELNAAGTISTAGLIDVTGDSAGTVTLNAGGDITFASGSEIRGNGASSLDEGERYADGATLDVTTTGGSITVSGDVNLRGQDQGSGGLATLSASHDVNIFDKIDAVGGGGDGGEVEISAGDDVTITFPIDVTSELGGGSGGLILIEAGDDTLGGAAPAGDLEINNTTLKAQGSAGDEFAGDGGALELSAAGSVRFLGAASTVRIDAATAFDGAGGSLLIESGDSNENVLGPNEGDVVLTGLISAGSGNLDGEGGDIFVSSGRDFTTTATIVLNGRGGGGDITVDAGRTVTIGGSISANGTSSNSQGGTLEFTSGEAVDAGLTLTTGIDAFGGTASGPGPTILLAGCDLTVSPSVKLDGHGGVDVAANLGGADMTLVSLRPMSLGANSSYLAGPGGSVTLRHPPGAGPIIGAGVTFDPGHTVVAGPTVAFLTCPGCGNGFLEPGEQCDDGNALDGDCCSSTCQLAPNGAVCRPAANICDVQEVCDGVSATCPADTLPPTDHYVMYKAKASKRLDLPSGGKFPGGWNHELNDITIDDAQADDPENYLIKKERSLVLPAMKNDEPGPANPALHYVRYQIKEAKEGAGPYDPGLERYPKAAKHTKGRVWQLANQFGTINVTTKKVEALMVPAAKDFGSQPPAPGDATHYKCYQAQVTKDVTDQTPDAGGVGKFRKDLEAFFGDQFDDCALDKSGEVAFQGTPVEGKCLYNLSKVKSLCNPVFKDDVGGTPPRETEAPGGSVSTPTTCRSLLCYQVKIASRIQTTSAAALADVLVDSSLRQSKHVKRTLGEGTAPFTTPGNNLPAPLQMDTTKTEFVCVPTDVTGIITPF